MYMHYGYGYHPSIAFGLIHIFATVLIVAAIIWLLSMVIRRRGPHGRHMWEMWESRSALQILSERFAKGEINKEEYEERKQVLLQK